MNPKSSWWKIVTVLALMATGAACADQSGDLGGAALPQEEAPGAEVGAVSAPVVDDAPVVGVDAVQPEAGIPTVAPRIRVTVADINLSQVVKDVTKGKGIKALGFDQLREIEDALNAQVARKLGGPPATPEKFGCWWEIKDMAVWTLMCKWASIQ